MTEPSAKVILDSISPAGHRLTTMEVVLHRFVLAEFNTHRVFSRNSASSRAIPVKKQIERVMTDPAIPLSWPAEKPGMQGGEELTDTDKEWALGYWLKARDAAVHEVRALTRDTLERPVHKSVANRLLEPFMWHTVIVSSTEWDNFFGLRCNPLAQPEIQAAAYAMRDAYEKSNPQPRAWHLPYINEYDGDLSLSDCKKVSAARCARVSYLTQDGVRDPTKDIDLYERLISADPPHSSPLEHVATPASIGDVSGNFHGWHQLRHLVGK
jgi:thymidylate synthase ThyX